MKYRLRSIFSSIQGEGRNTGRPATFVRFAGCNLNCPWCDTQKQARQFLALPEIVSEVRRLGNRMVIVTGGEPTTVVGLGDVLKALKDDGRWLALETNGTLNIPELELFDYVSVSPKFFYASHYSDATMIHSANEVRIVAENETMVAFCRDMRGRIKADYYFISPLEENGVMHYRRAFNLMNRLNAVPRQSAADAPWPPWSLSIQTHKVLGLK